LIKFFGALSIFDFANCRSSFSSYKVIKSIYIRLNKTKFFLRHILIYFPTEFCSLICFHCSISFILVQGKFLLGTPRTCESPSQPEHGRWVCSYGKGENGRSLCILDCKRDYIIEDRPLIFNCVNGAWEMFPTPGSPVERPWGRCISVELYKARVNEDAVSEKRSEAVTERSNKLWGIRDLEEFIDSL